MSQNKPLKKILLVDDRQENLYLLDSLLKGSGYAVEQATNGEEALKLAHNSQPDMIVADVLMPVMDGFELCHKIRTDKTLRNTAFIFYTASYLDQRDKALAKNLGVDRYLLKPQEPAELLRVFREVLEEHDGSSSGDEHQQPLHEKQYLREHNESLVRMLEKKVLELDQSRQILEEEVQVRKQAEEKLKASLLEKEVLLKEIYHRTKNNMQVIVGLLDLQARKLGENSPEVVFREMSDRIFSMSLVHDLLFRSKNLYEIQLDQYLQSLAERLLTVYRQPELEVELDLQLLPTRLNIQFAVPLGLVINEILSNSMKHAFPGRATGRIFIVAHESPVHGLMLQVGDNGVGLAEVDAIKDAETLGAHIIRTVVEYQLRGKLTLDGLNGVTYTLDLPDTLLQ